MSCSKYSSIASFWEIEAQWTILPSCLRPLAAAFERLQHVLALGADRVGHHHRQAHGGGGGDDLRQLEPARGVLAREALHLLDRALGLAPHGDRLALRAEVDVGRVDESLAQPVLLATARARCRSLRGAEQRGVDRRLVDQVVRRLGGHRVGRGHAAGRGGGLDDEDVEPRLGHVARGHQAVVAGADDDDVR